ncbi:MAG: helix-turn-helix transcriptional regulator [Rhodothermaceae bacterium]|nr:helix-turn-helix transcriptional regulator [Rhodothermaceae bacterium]
MQKGYGQYCPLAIAMELLGQRWTVLVISRIIDGCHTFNEIHRGVPKISPSLLSQRLNDLIEHGIVRKEKQPGKNTFNYYVTEAGQDLEGIIMNIAVWGQHWGRDMKMEDLDPAFLAWSMHTRINSSAMPPGRTVLEFEFTGIPHELNRFWLVNTDGNVDMCLKHPGMETDLLITADLKTFVEAWRGLRDLRAEINERQINLTGPSELRKAFPDWLLLSSLAPYARKRAGEERALVGNV